MNKKIKFVIYSSKQKWGGAIVLHSLCKNLSDNGYNAKIFYMNGHPYGPGIVSKIKYYFTYIAYTAKTLLISLLSKVDPRNLPRYNGYKNLTIKGLRRKFLPFVDSNTIVIYSDMVYGNPLKASKVIRWLLYYFQFENKQGAYDSSDLFITYRNEFNNIRLNPQNYKLQMPYINLKLYRRTNYGNRQGKCYVIRKGKTRTDLPSNFDGVIIDDLYEEDKVKVFNKCEYCISYDTQTMYSSIAAICGCKSIIIPEMGKDVRDYRNGEDKRYGIAIGFSEQQSKFAENTLPLLQKEFEDMNNNSIKEVKKFLTLVNNIFGKK